MADVRKSVGDPPFEIGNLVTSEFYATEKDVVRKITACGQSKTCGSGWFVSMDGGVPCPGCGSRGHPLLSVDSGWAKKFEGPQDGPQRNADGKYEIWIVWNEHDSDAAEDGRWNDMENEACRYEFNTEAELNAFVYGVNEAVGWMESYTLEGEALKEYLEATREGDEKCT